MASALDKLREHTAALEAVVRAAQEIERVLERVQAELVPLVGDLREVRRKTEEIQKRRDAEGFSWAVLVVICSALGVLWGAWLCWRSAGDLRDRRSRRLWECPEHGRISTDGWDYDGSTSCLFGTRTL